MSGVDKETVEKALDAFAEQESKLDEWAAEVSADTGESGADKDGVTVLSVEKGTGESVPDLKVDAVVRTSTSKLTRDEARKLVEDLYDEFDDVVGPEGELHADRLAEYTSVITYWYTSFKTKEEKMGTFAKYPKFLELFGKKSATDISVGDVMKKFGGKTYEEAIKADEQADRIANVAGIIIANKGVDFSRKLDEDDYALLAKFGVDDPRRFHTMGELTGISAETLLADDGSGVVYNSDYDEAVRGMFGGLTEGNECAAGEEVTLDDVMGGISPMFMKRVFKMDKSDVREVPDCMEDDDSPADTIVCPFDVPGGMQPHLDAANTKVNLVEGLVFGIEKSKETDDSGKW